MGSPKDPPPPAPPADPLAGVDPDSLDGALKPGSFVGEYQIETLIGEGGMGSVYRAVQPIIGKKVAIKVLAGVLSRDGNAQKRFALEARAVNEIGHRNLVDIFSFGRLPDGRHYYVMEFLEGHSLGEVLRERGKVPAQEVFPLFRDIGRALAAAHGKGIIHRDLKPDNVIMVADKDQPGVFQAKLLDFGVAKLLEQDTVPGAPKTQAGATLGTPQYMAPEQCVGGKIDARTDIYALGVMFFQVLTGRVPFDGNTVIEIWQGHVSKPPPKLSDVAPDMVATSSELEALILQMLAKDPKKRLQSAAQFCEALDAVAPTLGVPRARLGREPRLSQPLVKPATQIVVSEPGGLPRPDTRELRAMADSFEVHRLVDVVSLDEAMGMSGQSGMPAPAPAPVRAPVPNEPTALPIPGPPTHGPMAAAPDPHIDVPMAELHLDGPSRARRYRPTLGPTPTQSSTTSSPARRPAVTAQTPVEATSASVLPIVIGILVVALLAAGAMVFMNARKHGGGGGDTTPSEQQP